MLRTANKKSTTTKKTILPHKSALSTRSIKKSTKSSPLHHVKRGHAGCSTTTPHNDTTITPPNTQIHTAESQEQEQPTIRATLSKDPTQRFKARNEFIQKRHTQKDHLIHTHHNDVRIFACNITNTLRTAVQKHKMSLLEAETWGGYAAGTALYAGLLRGNDRIIVEAFLNNEKDETNHIYVEAFAVGEIRGFSSVKHPKTNPDNDIKTPGEGVMRLTKALYQHKRKFQSALPATGDPMNDWQFVYSQSEQIPTYVQTETLVHEDENGEVIVDFCGASLVQVLGGEATPTERLRILAEKKLKRLEDETDDQYVKRVQLFDHRNRIIDQNMPDMMKKFGSAGYVSQVLGVDPETLGNPLNIHNIGNVDKVFDWEIFERSLLQSALRDKPIANVINSDGVAVTEGALQQDGKFQYHFEYRPLQFFCRCYQTDTHGKLMSLPKDLLESLLEDEVVTFTCDFCAVEDEITRAKVQIALDEKAEMEKVMAEQAKQEQLPPGTTPETPPQPQEGTAQVTH